MTSKLLHLAAVYMVVLLAAGCTEENEDAYGEGKQICNPGATVCESQILRTCNQKGNNWSSKDCAVGSQNCLPIQGVARCTSMLCDPGSGGCASDGLTTRTCSADGKTWTDGKACDLKKGELCHDGSCKNACTAAAASRQNVGCTFYPVNLHNSVADKVGVVVGNLNKVEATVTLADATKILQTRTIKPGSMASFIISPGLKMLKGTGKAAYAFKLSSTLPVAAYQFSPLNKAENRSSDASLLLAKPALGKLHYVMSAPVAASEDFSYVTVVGVEAGTKVTVKPSTATLAGGGIPALKEGQAYSATLGAQEILQLATSTKFADMTGTRVTSDKPVAVFGGHTCANLPISKSYCDHIQEQMFPVQTWGREYLAAKFMPRGKYPEDDWWRILAAADGTQVTISGSTAVVPAAKTLKAGEYFQINTSESFVIKADKAISVGHYVLGQEEVTLPLDTSVYNETFQTPKGCTTSTSQGNLGDPAISMAVPVAQFRDGYVFLTPDTYRYDFLTVLIKTAKQFPEITLDGKTIPIHLTPITGTGLGYARFRITDGPHQINSNTPIGIEVHGYDCNVSYAYSGGLSLDPINPIK